MVEVEYRCNILSEAMSYLWLEAKKRKPIPEFSLATLVSHGKALNHEMEPYMWAADEVDRLMTWQNFYRSAAALAYALFTAYYVKRVMVIFHLTITAMLLYFKFGSHDERDVGIDQVGPVGPKPVKIHFLVEKVCARGGLGL